MQEVPDAYSVGQFNVLYHTYDIRAEDPAGPVNTTGPDYASYLDS